MPNSSTYKIASTSLAAAGNEEMKPESKTAIIAVSFLSEPHSKAVLAAHGCKARPDFYQTDALHSLLLNALKEAALLDPQRFADGAHYAGKFTDCLFAYEVFGARYNSVNAGQIVIDVLERFFRPSLMLCEVAKLQPPAETFRTHAWVGGVKRLDGITFEQLISLLRSLNEKASTTPDRPRLDPPRR